MVRKKEEEKVTEKKNLIFITRARKHNALLKQCCFAVTNFEHDRRLFPPSNTGRFRLCFESLEARHRGIR